MYYIYLLRCQNNSLYTGITTDVTRRLQEHQKGKKCAKYTRIYTPLKMEAIWKCETRSLALKLEYQLKQLPKVKKENLIKNETLFKEIFEKKVNIENYYRLK